MIEPKYEIVMKNKPIKPLHMSVARQTPFASQDGANAELLRLIDKGILRWLKEGEITELLSGASFFVNPIPHDIWERHCQYDPQLTIGLFFNLFFSNSHQIQPFSQHELKFVTFDINVLFWHDIEQIWPNVGPKLTFKLSSLNLYQRQLFCQHK